MLLPAVVVLAAAVPAQLHEIIETYVDGTVRARYAINSKGQKTGSYVSYYRGGTVRARTVYHDNIRHGRYESYYRDGSKRLSTTYRKGKLNGKHTEHSRDGRRTRTVHYQDGVMHGSSDVVLDGKSLTRQVWKHGTLFQLNGHQPFPRTL